MVWGILQGSKIREVVVLALLGGRMKPDWLVAEEVSS